MKYHKRAVRFLQSLDEGTKRRVIFKLNFDEEVIYTYNVHFREGAYDHSVDSEEVLLCEKEGHLELDSAHSKAPLTGL